MKREDIIFEFGNVTKISKIAGKSISAISQWEQNGVPADCQRIFYYMTNGKLVPSPGIAYTPISEVKDLLKDKGE